MATLAAFRRTLVPTVQSLTRSYASKPSKSPNSIKIAHETEPYTRLPPILRRLHEAKAFKGLTFESLAKEIGRNEVYVAALFYGQAKPSPEDITALSKTLGVDEHPFTDEMGPHWWPNRGLGGSVPQDPVIYRLYEGVIVYGHPIKAIIHEKFGDGIMSMIDCKVNVDRKPNPKGDRVVITFDGKFLPYNQN